jgi:type II secretory pathway component PulF
LLQVAEQQDDVAQILEDAETSQQMVRQGTRELAEAATRPSSLRDFMVGLLLVLATVLLVLDWFHR